MKYKMTWIFLLLTVLHFMHNYFSPEKTFNIDFTVSNVFRYFLTFCMLHHAISWAFSLKLTITLFNFQFRFLLLPYFSINLGAFLEIFIAPVFIVLVVVTTASVAVIVKLLLLLLSLVTITMSIIWSHDEKKSKRILRRPCSCRSVLRRQIAVIKLLVEHIDTRRIFWVCLIILLS